MKVLHILPSYSIQWGGPPKVVYELSRALSQKGVKVDILTTFGDDDILYPLPEGVNLIRLKRNSTINKLWKGFSWEAFSFFLKKINQYDIIHIHELWHFLHFIAFLFGKGKPYIVSVHGELDEWCLNHKRTKKAIYSLLIQKRILKKAKIIHALTSYEKLEIEKYLNTKRYADKIEVIPNGLDLSEFKELSSEISFKKRFPQLEGKKYILFLGRINVKKGIDILLKAFKALTNEYKNLYLVVAGPDDGYLNEAKRQITELGINEKVIFPGTLTGTDKIVCYKEAELFVLPSYSEGFPMAVIEAMAYVLPVIISNKVGIYREIEDCKAGIVVDTNPESLYKGIKVLLDNEPLRKELVSNGLRLVKEHYSIEKVADKMIKVYESALKEDKLRKGGII